MLLAAAHNSEIAAQPGLLSKSNVRNNAQNHYLDFRHWAELDLYETVEHIVPDSIPGEGWPADVYNPSTIRQKLGNATLLPKIENSILGNKDWKFKKKFFLALFSGNLSDLNKIIDEFEKDGKSLRKKTKKTLQGGTSLPILEPITKVEIWDKKVIEERTNNIASLCWDQVSNWLF